MRKLLLLCACMVLLSLGAFAQTGEAYIGFSNFTWGKNGWNGDLGYNLAKNIQVEGDFGGYYSHNNSIHSFMGGVKAQATRRRRGFEPWGHFLIGGSHVSRLNESSDTALSWALGGGIDTNVFHKVGLRLSADAVHTNFNDSGDLHLRLGAGFLYRF